MRKLVVFLGIILLLSSFALAVSVTGHPVTSANYNSSPDSSLSNADDENESDHDVNETDDDEDDTLETVSKNVYFCGKSTYGSCETDSDCVKGGCSNQVCQSKNEESEVTTCEWKDCYNSTRKGLNCVCIKNKCMWNKLTEDQIRNIIKKQNRINVTAKHWETCPSGCTCTGSTVKCQLANGRIMTVYAGKSGNVIIQVKGENMTTNVTLYKSGEHVYGVFKGNETKELNMFQEQVRERIREKLNRALENENISLDDEGVYQYKGEKKARLFFVFPVKILVRAEVDPETGEVIKLSKGNWWAFLAKDESQQMVGISCGTVTPGQNDGCCQGRGFDVWNAETQQCEFSS